MGMTIEQAEKLLDSLATQEELLCKRADDASGYTRSGNESIRTSNAKTYEQHAKEYRQILRYLAEYRLMQADYETRLKADMVAMLTDIQLEIEENSYPENVYGDEYGIDEVISTDEIYQFIQQKIDALKAESEPQESKDNKCQCYDCKHFEKEGWSHCKIHEWALGDSKCSDYEE